MNHNCLHFFKALANEDRLKIVQLLHTHNEMCAQDIEKHFFLQQSTTSHHLNTLRRAGIVKAYKKGRHVFYSIHYHSFMALIEDAKTLVSQ
jgi:DNA-binding transcriptional ArsR family regulator